MLARELVPTSRQLLLRANGELGATFEDRDALGWDSLLLIVSVDLGASGPRGKLTCEAARLIA